MQHFKCAALNDANDLYTLCFTAGLVSCLPHNCPRSFGKLQLWRLWHMCKTSKTRAVDFCFSFSFLLSNKCHLNCQFLCTESKAGDVNQPNVVHADYTLSRRMSVCFRVLLDREVIACCIASVIYRRCSSGGWNIISGVLASWSNSSLTVCWIAQYSMFRRVITSLFMCACACV